MHCVHELLATGDRCQRHAGGDPLGRGDQVGHHALVVAGEPRAGAAEARLDLIGDEHDAVGGRPLAQRREEAWRGNDEAALALDRLDQDGGQVLGPDLHLDLADHIGCRLGAAAAAVAERVGHRHPVDLGCEGSEAVLVRHVLGRERHGQVGAPVVGVVEGDHGGAACGEACDLDGVLDGLRT